MAHWSSADGPTGARTGSELSGAHWDHRAQSVESFPWSCKLCRFHRCVLWRTRSRYHGLQIVEISLTLARHVGSGRDRRIFALRFRTSRCSSRHPSWSLFLSFAEQVQPAPVVEYVTPARTVTCAAPVTTITVTSTVFPTATVLLANCAEAREIQQVQILDKLLTCLLLLCDDRCPWSWLCIGSWWSWTCQC